MKGVAKDLSSKGVVVIDVFTAQEASRYYKDIKDAIARGCEVRDPDNTSASDLVLGSFGAFGTPTSFHAPQCAGTANTYIDKFGTIL